MRHLIIIAALALTPCAVLAAEPTSPPAPMHHDGAVHQHGGTPAGKATFKEFTVTKKTDSASTGLVKCAGGVTVQGPDGTQACDAASTPSDMAVNEKGTGTDPEPKKTPK